MSKAERSNKRWTEKDDKMLYDKRFPDAYIARMLGRTELAIKKRRYNLTRKKKQAQ